MWPSTNPVTRYLQAISRRDGELRCAEHPTLRVAPSLAAVRLVGRRVEGRLFGRPLQSDGCPPSVVPGLRLHIC